MFPLDCQEPESLIKCCDNEDAEKQSIYRCWGITGTDSVKSNPSISIKIKNANDL